MDNYSMQHEEFTKNNWLRQYDASIMMRPFYFNDFNQEKSDKFYDDSYNYFLKQFEGFSEIELKLLVIAALIVTALLVFVFISTVTMTIGLFFYDQIEIIVVTLLVHGFYISIVVSPVFNIILIFLAVQRFLLNFKSIYWSLLVVFLHFLFLMLHLLYWLKGHSIETIELLNLLVILAYYIHFILEFLALISVVVYIPMFISIRKLLYLPSLAQSQPQKYIMYQIIFIFIGKLFLLFTMRLFASKVLGWPFLEPAFVITNLSTFYLTPLIIQMTYLFCNKKNTQLVISYLSIRFVIDKLRRLLHMTNNVQPVVPTDGTTVQPNIPTDGRVIA
ncbi:hypothetical protein CRE_14663 [Caenorhabditis remanei]|uniref:Uncharacterized protein n=1 Tax=Caenorhabditis remanei TaxID=31234 RepID=E3M9F0_CAERE|nr:hypothetical protein CRE_14663 [Caenorhabditis remanei]